MEMKTNMTAEQMEAAASRYHATMLHYAVYRCDEPWCSFEGSGPGHAEHVLQTGHWSWSYRWPDAVEGQVIARCRPTQ